MSLTKRQEEILFAIIEEYAEIATPVGSVTLAKLFDVSSATIRAEMARLEESGYIAQPHTSAGRVPTDAGYRYYVNSLTESLNSDRTNEVHISPQPLPERSSHVLEARISSQSRADQAIRGAVDSLVELTGNLGLATIGFISQASRASLRNLNFSILSVSNPSLNCSIILNRGFAKPPLDSL